VIFDWIDGSTFAVKTGETGLTMNIYTGLQEFNDMAFLLHVLRPGDLFVDVGANLGSYTVLACSAKGANGIAFEPVPESFDRLVQNVRLNNIEATVQCIHKGVAQKKGTLHFTKGSGPKNHVLPPGEETEDCISVEMDTLDSTLVGRSPFLIKIDVEGFETEVIEGASSVLKDEALSTVIMELNGSGNRYGFNEENVLEKMLNLGFQTYSYEPFSRTLNSLEGKNVNSGNTLFIRERSLVEKRLREADAFKIYGKSI
jgi:FkbM family methyltransferase